MKTTKELATIIKQTIDELSFKTEPAGLYLPLDYVMNLGGKRIRPLLCLMAYNMYHDEGIEKVIPPALGIEMYHNFTLLHDDVMDRSFMRRGKPCVHVKWDENTAILSGDALHVVADQYVQQVPDAVLRPCMDCYLRTALEVCEGQEMDMYFESQERVDKTDYLEMIRLKTAVLLACSLKIGALIAEAPQEDVEWLYRFGIDIGIAFQIKDDLLDVWGNPSLLGKPIGGDIMCNKKTFLLIQAMEKADEKKRIFLREYLKSNDIDRGEKIRTVTELYNQLGVREDCEAQMRYHQTKAMKALAQLSVPEERWAPLRTLAEEMMDRQL